ncbi:MAG: alpha/beta fold hydrolase [Yoonia sp.]|uniref:alpha/beta fold hydrolase n=1 Tax=Yoonia sp. TaxID=2212373 RepID=UPI003EF24697
MDWVVVFFVVAGLVMLAVWPFYLERRRERIGPDARHKSKGAFARLSQGVTHYRWTGSARGPVAIVVHGLATPMQSVEPVAKALGDLGYRVLIYDLYGRGLSDAPRGKQNRAYFLRQLSDLLQYLGLDEDVTLAGYSMGGAIVTAYAAENHFAVKQVILVAPAGIIINENRFARFCRRVPLLGDWVHAAFAGSRIRRSIPTRGATPEVDAVLRAQRKELNRRGYLPSILASRRGMLAELQEREHRQLYRKGIPVCAVWAGLDPIIPQRAIGRLAEWNRNARHEVVNSADHAMPYTHGDAVAKAMRSTMFK